MSASPAALALEDVSLAQRERPVLSGASLSLAFGEVLVLAGRNGAGKTTLLRIATGLVAPDAGRVLLEGRPLAAHSRREIARSLALVPQDTSVPFPFRVEEVVLLGRAPHLGAFGFESREDRRIAGACMERLGIGALAQRSILELSGGERQLAMIARALAQTPRILLLDEPVAHLDLAHRLALEELLRSLAREGKAALLVSHDLAGAARVADRIALLANGRVLACGTPREALRPALMSEAFGVDAQLVETSEGPVVVPRRAG
ncbi:MAG TPA: ABC transporter ATP-binding protein [Myxococcota bacterium]|jgi:iron complex transport system ATP-binding protein